VPVRARGEPAPPRSRGRDPGAARGSPRGWRFRVARAVRFRELVDRGSVREWLRRQSRREDLRMLLLGHGAPVVGDVRAALALAATHV
jgi:hypothetical protein